ncbi:MAG: enoyl-CoA hydratase/isomerase family protein [Acidimicrobiia bacterium]
MADAVTLVTELPAPVGPVLVDLDAVAEAGLAELYDLERRGELTVGVARSRCEGFGLAVATAVDLLVAAPSATFGRPGRWSPVVLRRGEGIVGRRAAGYLVMTGRSIGAATALDWGLVSHVADDPVAAATELVASIAARSPVAVRTILAQAHRGAAADYTALRATSRLV